MKRVMRKQDRKEDKEREKVGSGKRNSQGYLFRDLVYFNKKTFHFPEVDVNLKPHLSLSLFSVCSISAFYHLQNYLENAHDIAQVMGSCEKVSYGTLSNSTKS